ncbi:MAG: hypothetical protein ABSC25_00455 [Roseiarcus sp.]|jgi:hypothetical protein
MAGQEVVFGKRGAPAKPAAPPRREAPSAAFLAASEAARAAFLHGHPDRELDAEPALSGRSAARDEEADMRRFIGANWAGYRDLWLKMKDAPALAPSRSYAAAAFTGLWLLFRRRYGLVLTVMALQFGVTFAAPLFGAPLDLVVALIFGRYGKALVVRDGFAAIARIRGERGAADDADLRIAQAGGTSVIALIAGAFLALWLLLIVSGEAPRDAGALLDALVGVKI